MNGSLDGMVEELNRLLVQAEAEVYTRTKALDEAKKDIQKIRAMLKAAGALEEEPKPEPKAQRRVEISEETRQLVLGAIMRYEQAGREAVPGIRGSFTAKDITGDFHPSSARTAINVFREEGTVRAVGKVPNSPRIAPMAYARVAITEDEAGALVATGEVHRVG